MNESERQYRDRIEQRKFSRCESESLDGILPEWVINLKNYFEKGHVEDYSFTSN